jgi:hypothetical protein
MMIKVSILKYIYSGLERARHDRVSTVRVWDIEFSYNVKDFLDAWNI